MSKDLFVGTWSLVSSEIRTSDGEVLYPLGQDCSGILIFDTVGTLSAQLMRRDRPMFASGDIVRGTDDEVKAAYQGFVSFWGDYEVDEVKQELRYVVRGSLFPNWIGQQNLRFYDFSDNRLTCRTPPFLMAGKEIVGALIWRRLG